MLRYKEGYTFLVLDFVSKIPMMIKYYFNIVFILLVNSNKVQQN